MNFPPLLLIIISVVLYSFSLQNVPVHLNQDELGFSLNAYSIAKTGFDENGRFFPLYFWHLGVMYGTPIIVYLTSLFLLILPVSEVTIRLPSVLIAVSNVVLIYLLAKRIFNSKKLGFLAGVLLALTPIHFIQGRILLDNLYPVPFVLGWLYMLFLFLEKKNPTFVLIGSFLLGLGVHSYHAAKIMMPIYLLFTLLAVYKELIKKKYLILVVLMGFALPLIPLFSWLSKYPDTLTDQVKYTGLYDTKLNPIQGILTLLTPETILARVSVYLSYFSPEFLFFNGDTSLIHSTRKIGVFLLPFILLIPLGIYKAIRIKSKLWFFLIAGFFTAPIAPALVGNQYRASKELIILPFAILIAIYGLQFLFKLLNNRYKLITFCLLIFIFLQFAIFIYDYFTDYKKRSYVWFNYNIPGSLETIIKQEEKDEIKKIYLDGSIYFIDRYWEFVLIKHAREDLLHKTLYFDPKFIDPKKLETNSLFLVRFDHVDKLDTVNQFKKVDYILEPDGSLSFYILTN